ncbi:MAG: YbaB/EbfC family nucleoid-associated protein [Frankia sp.]
MDLSALRARVEGMAADFERMRAETGAVRERLLAVRGKAKSEDRFVTAEVDSRGRLVNLEIDPRVFRRPDARRLAEVIVETVGAAVARSEAMVEEAFDGLASPESLQAVLGFDVEAMVRGIQAETDGLSKGVDR